MPVAGPDILFASHSLKKSATRVRPAVLATASGVALSASFAEGFAPFSKSSLTTSTWPKAAAKWSGVEPLRPMGILD